MVSDIPMTQRDFKLGRPALVCRWRLSACRLPMANRHLRALGARTVNGGLVATELVAWAKQHIEWTLQDGAAGHPDGVLMVVVDEEGQAAMTVGPYEELRRRSVKDLVSRANISLKEAQRTHVAPESLWAVGGDELICGLPGSYCLSGASSLIMDLARTLGMAVRMDDDLVWRIRHEDASYDEVFLVSDEYGVVPATNARGTRSEKFATSYRKLLAATR